MFSKLSGFGAHPHAGHMRVLQDPVSAAPMDAPTARQTAQDGRYAVAGRCAACQVAETDDCTCGGITVGLAPPPAPISDPRCSGAAA